jgi:hypothetical protein
MAEASGMHAGERKSVKIDRRSIKTTYGHSGAFALAVST